MLFKHTVNVAIACGVLGTILGLVLHSYLFGFWIACFDYGPRGTWHVR